MALRKETTKHHAREIKHKEKIKKAKEHRKQRRLRKESGAPVGIPQTLESLRTKDPTVCDRQDPDLLAEQESDEVADIYRGERQPKLLLTFSDRVSPRTVGFCKELAKVIPSIRVYARWHLPLKKIIPKAIEHNFTAVMIVNEDAKKINTLVVTYLPHGPTVTFRVSNVFLRREMRGRHGRRAKDIEPGITPHLVMTRFTTRLGLRTERLLGALFPSECRSDAPQQHSRTVVFHNQRDFIFFRHYRYQQRMSKAEESEEGTSRQTGKPYIAMNEVGPRFTLKLKSIQLGTFDSQFGNYEWVFKRSEVGRSRRTFVL